MSFELAGRIIGDPEIRDPYEFTVLLALADATNKETHTCYPSVGRIAFFARISRRKAFLVIKALERKSWVQIIRRRGKKKMSQSSIYQIIKYGAPDAPLAVHTVHKGGAHRAPPPSAHRAPKPGKNEPIKEPEHLSASFLPDPNIQDSVATGLSDFLKTLRSQ